MEVKEVYLVDSEGNKHLIDKMPYTIGSFDTICDLVVNDSKVSPIHAIISQDGDETIIKDQNTSLGIIVNDTNIQNGQQQVLKSGDAILVGDSVYTFKIDEPRLLTDEEVERLNKEYEDLIASKSLKKESGHLLDVLFDKVIQVCEVFKEKDQNLFKESIRDELKPLLEILSGETLEEIVPKTEEKKEEKPVQEPKVEIPVEKKNSFNLRRRSVDLNVNQNTNNADVSFNLKPEGEPAPGPERSQSRRIQVDPNKLNRKVSKNKVQERKVSHPILENQKKERVLILTETKYPYLTINITNTPFKIGRDSDLVDFVLDRTGISRHHITILSDDRNQGYILRDENATNGTYLNDVRIVKSEAGFSKGDIIKLYENEFKVIRTE